MYFLFDGRIHWFYLSNYFILCGFFLSPFRYFLNLVVLYSSNHATADYSSLLFHLGTLLTLTFLSWILLKMALER